MRVLRVALVLALVSVPMKVAGTMVIPAANEMTVNGVWETADFARARYLRLEVKWPAASLVITSGTRERGEWVYLAKSCSLKNGNLTFIGQDAAGGQMKVFGEVRANSMAGKANLTLSVPKSSQTVVWGDVGQGPRFFVKRESVSRAQQLVKSEQRADELAEALAASGTAIPK
jgi:hypothetical protein